MCRKRAQVKRPYGIETFSYNEQGDQVEEKFYGFPARVYCHEVDHMKGQNMVTWSVSEGNISVCDTENPDDHYYFLNSVDHWREQIKEAVA